MERSYAPRPLQATTATVLEAGLICRADLGLPLNRVCPFINLVPDLVMAILGPPL